MKGGQNFKIFKIFKKMHFDKDLKFIPHFYPILAKIHNFCERSNDPDSVKNKLEIVSF